MSRHTALKGSLTRSLGASGDEDLVVELAEPGILIIRREPLGRRLRRGEELPQMRIDLREAAKNMSGGFGEDAVGELIKKLPLASWEADKPATVAYKAKVWMLQQLKLIKDAGS